MGSLDRVGRFCRTLALTQKSASSLIRAENSRQGRSVEYTHHIMQSWAQGLLDTLRVDVEYAGKPSPEPTLFIGNHVSYLDIPLLMSRAPVVFLAKKELASWPIFGRAMRSVGTVFVDRGSPGSRKVAAEAIAPAVHEGGYSVAVFASGTTSITEDKPWRWGAFSIAKRFNIPLQPFRLTYEPLRTVAYIDEDFFASHLWSLVGTSKIKARLEFADRIPVVEDPEAEARRWWQWARDGLTRV
ncbi:1-acyl-sn-glycerol-3-phosphate acyltransferase [bacterium]|nr:1-acyl-sn-glycerol-3-phosphate acyltransferase [bacterium]